MKIVLPFSKSYACLLPKTVGNHLLTIAHINQIGTSVPQHDVHDAFRDFVRRSLVAENRSRTFERMAGRSGISHRYSVLNQSGMVEADAVTDGFYRRGAYPGTAPRMRIFEAEAPGLAERAVEALDLHGQESSITHLVVATCTGFVAPGIDQILAKRLGLRPDLQRTMVGFMGCSAAIPALRIAQATIGADSRARVLVVNIELCTLHLQETDDLETALSFLLFGDGCSAALVTAEPSGIALGDFITMLIPDSDDMITWHVGDHGFNMHLSGKVPGLIMQALRDDDGKLLRGEGTQSIDFWAVHGGGRSILDAVETGLNLPPNALAHSRHILREFGNMSSATVMFVLERIMREDAPGQRGLAMAFGPGMVAETFRFKRLN
jgi:predicted naringenin-chalcone synthase